MLGQRLPGSVVEGIAGGAGWLSLRVSGSYLWLMVLPSLRAAWLDEHPVPGAWLHALGRHKESPFAPHLEHLRPSGSTLLVNQEGAPCGLALTFASEPPLRLCVGFWPRPGGIWLDGGHNELLARSGDVIRSDLVEAPAAAAVPAAGVDPPTAAPFDAAAHASAARTLLTAHLQTGVRKRVRDVLAGAAGREQRRITALQADLHDAQEGAALRARADVLAAHLHAVPARSASVTLTGFDSQPVTIALDPAMTPARNLDAMYRRAGRSERKAQQATARLVAAQGAKARADEAMDELTRRSTLDGVLELAVELGVDFAPVRAGAHRSQRHTEPQQRLPYRVFVLASGVEVRVGRSAADNDALTRSHSALTDLWLHAQGVEGSHVILRTGGRPIPPHDAEQAAQLAALFSKARTSKTVPVVVTERRFVRKPRGSPAGLAVAERAKTLFVTPRMPVGCSQKGPPATEG